MSDNYRVTAGTDTLMRQGPMTAEVYMLNAITDIDSAFGKGFAKKNSNLVGSYMQTAAMDASSSFIARSLDGILEVMEATALSNMKR